MSTLTPAQELEQFEALFTRRKDVGSTWYVVAMKWWKSWKSYTGFAEHGETIKRTPTRPGKINNKTLEGDRKGTMESGALLDEDFVLLNKKSFDFIFKQYKGGPIFERSIVLDETHVAIVEMDPPIFTSYPANSAGMPDKKNKKVMSFSRCHTTKLVYDRVIKVLKIKHDCVMISIRDTSDGTGEWGDLVRSPNLLIGDLYSGTSFDLLAEKNEDWTMDLLPGAMCDALLEGSWYECQIKEEKQEDSTIKVHALGQPEAMDAWLTKESKDVKPAYSKTQNWRVGFKPGKKVEVSKGEGSKKKWFIGTVLEVEEEHHRMQVEVSYGKRLQNEWLTFLDERLGPPNTHIKEEEEDIPDAVDLDGVTAKESMPGKPLCEGAVGFQNLGNTCFMNSINQCMSNSEPMCTWFLSGDYKADINKDNFLGSGGKLAVAFAEMLEEMWSGKFQLVVPTKYKYCIGQVNETFAGYQQQDAQEYLAFMVDGIHEDLNRILKKPPTDPVENEDRPVEDVANDTWKVFLMRNLSTVTDHMMGMTKSSVTCPNPDCDYERPTFDVYSLLSVPLPLQSNRSIQFILHLRGQPVTKCCAKVPRNGLLREISEWICKTFDKQKHLTPYMFVYFDTFGKRLGKLFELSSPLGMVEIDEAMHVYEVDELDYVGPKPAHEGPVDENADDRWDDYKPKTKYYPKKDINYYLLEVLHREPIKEAKILVYGKGGSLSTPGMVSVSPVMSFRKLYEKVWEDCKYFCKNQDDWSAENLPFDIYFADCSGVTRGELIPNDAESFFPEGEPVCVDFFKKLSSKSRGGDHSRSSTALVVEWKAGSYTKKKADHVINHESVPAKKSTDSGAEDDGESVKIQDCIDKYVEPEVMGDDNSWKCSKCEKFGNMMKTFEIWSVPELLVFQLKRFSFTQTEMGIQKEKIESLVTFPVKGLDFSEWVQGPQKKTPSCLIYDLYGVSNHIGGTGGGHYTAYGLNYIDEQWYSFNDAFCNECEPLRTNSKFAYLIFYKRRYRHAEKMASKAAAGSKKKDKKKK